jgi:glycosyltransferase involved in cell wall biosynthesis
VSVVMPVFRPCARHLEEALDSVINQSLRDWELVIVEDPSDRQGGTVVAHRADPRIRYTLNERRTGLAHQHNLAVSQTRGELIARFDSDDVCEPDRLAKQADYLQRNPHIDILASQLTIIDEGGRVTGVRDYPLEHEAIVRAMRRYNPISGSNVMFRRCVLERGGGWREDVDRPAQDYEWYSRLASLGCRFATHPDRLVRYRRHSDQIKARRLRGTILTSLEVKRRYWLSSMDPFAFAQFLGEAALLAMPTRAVLWLLKTVHYR